MSRILRPSLRSGLAIASGAASFIAYAATAARAPYWGDSCEFVAVAHTLGIAHPPGYPLYTLLSAIAVRLPVGGPSFRVALLSSAFGAVAVSLVVSLTWRLIGLAARKDGRPGAPVADAALPRAVASLVAGAVLALSFTFWRQSTVPEVYTLSAALVLAVLWLVLGRLPAHGRSASAPGTRGEAGAGRAVLLAGLLLGLGLAHHLTAALLVPSVLVALFLRREARPRARTIVAAALLVLAGLSFYAYLPIRSAQDPAVLWAPIGTFEGFVGHVAAAQYASRLFTGPALETLHRLLDLLRQITEELPWVVIALAGAGFWILWRRARTAAIALGLEAVLVLLHAAHYRIPDPEPYLIPVVAILAAAAGVGLAGVAGVVARLLTASHTDARAVRRARLAAASALILAAGAAVPLGRTVASSWRARDLSDNREVPVYAERMLESLDHGALLLGQEDRTIFPLWVALFVEGRRDDVALVPVRGRAPHFEKWFPWLRFPTESQLKSFYGREEAESCEPSGREVLSVLDYIPLFVELNAEDRPVYADVAIGRSLFPSTSAPRGLLVEIGVAGADSLIGAEELLGRPPWSEYLADLDGRGGTSPEAGRAYARALGEQGRLFLARGDPASGVAVLERAVALAPTDARLRSNLGVAYEWAGRAEEAVDEFERAVAAQPYTAAFHYNLSKALGARGDADGALDALRRAAGLEPANSRFAVELAALYERESRLADADRAFARAVDAAPDDWALRVAHGDYLARRRRYAEAVAEYRRAEELNPADPRVQQNLGRCYWAMRDVGTALAAMRRSIALQPRNPRLRYDLGVMLSQTGDLEGALASFDEALRLLPTMWQAATARAQVLARLGRTSQAREAFEEARRLGAGSDEFLEAWSRFERSTGDTVRASAILSGDI